MIDQFTDPWEPAYALIRRREGFAPVAKWDYQQYSGGYGSKAQPGETFTPEQAEARMRQEVLPLTSYLDRNVTVPMNDAQRAALVSFGYNTGLGSLQKITPDINSGDWQRVSDRIQGWNKAGGEVLSDLVNRRAEEGAMLTGLPFSIGAPTAAQQPAGATSAAAGPALAANSTLQATQTPFSIAGAIFGDTSNIGGTGIGFTDKGLSIPGLGTINGGSQPQQVAAYTPDQAPMSLAPIRRPLDMRGIQALTQTPRLGLLTGIA